MGGDYSRTTYDPIKRYTGIHKQQGRVSLDSDFNEFEEALDRRSRATMYDTVGQAVVPLTTPTGFKIDLVAGTLMIGAGRAYVDGIQTECFGDMTDIGKTVLDVNVGGVHGPGPVSYEKQPYFYAPAYPPALPAAGSKNLLYLDVWQREVTVLEDPGLREPALNGPDTATRVQTAWQVKALAVSANTTCTSPTPAWDTLTAPSTARLTAKAAAAPPDAGPCVINPAGGYTGLENRLYRVEIHEAGTLGGAQKATFKWSRDNASVGTSVLSIAPINATSSVLTVSSTGRTPMRFEHDDHVELLDDFVEFAMRETGKGGRMARVVAVNHASDEITVDTDLSPFFAAGRHPRIRKWDFATPAEPLVRPVDNGTAFALESGITVTFGDADALTLHAGDSWTFAARTADGSIDPVTNAPPRAILHHFARLALVQSGQVTDCRVMWPPKVPTGGHTGEGCCTAVVAVGDDIQKAIDSLNKTGGCVCLKMGEHTIAEPLRIQRDDITLHGEVPWVSVRRIDGGPHMLRVEARRNVSVTGISFQTRAQEDGSVIEVLGVTGGRIVDCAVTILDAEDQKVEATGISLRGCEDYAVETTRLQNLGRGLVGTSCSGIRVTDNTVVGRVVQRQEETFSAGNTGITFEDPEEAVHGIHVEHNLLVHYRRGIQLGQVHPSGLPTAIPVDIEGTHPGCRIVGNVVRREGRSPVSDALSFAIVSHVSRCEILENSVTIVGMSDGGIIASGGNAHVGRNEIRSTASFVGDLPRSLPFGVVITTMATDALVSTVEENLFTGLQQAILAVEGPALARGEQAARIDILENRIIGSQLLREVVEPLVAKAKAQSILLDLFNRCASILVAATASARVVGNALDATVCGIFCLESRAVSVETNRVTGTLAGIVVLDAIGAHVTRNRVTSAAEMGITAIAARQGIVAGNVVERCLIERGFGIAVVGGESNVVADNAVRGGSKGITLIGEADPVVRGSQVEDMSFHGIAAWSIEGRLGMDQNNVLRCGYRDPDDPGTVAIGILVDLAGGLAVIESCKVFDIGEPSSDVVNGAPTFRGRRIGISVGGNGSARVWNCVVSSVAVSEKDHHPGTRAILIDLSANKEPDRDAEEFSDASDNVVQQTAQVLVEIVSRGEVMFATNHCISVGEISHSQPAVLLRGAFVTVTGNRIRARGKSPLRVTAVGMVTAVGNIVSGVPIINGPEHPIFNTVNSIV